MRNILFLTLVVCLMEEVRSQQQVVSPNGEIKVNVQAKDALELSIFLEEEALVDIIKPRMVLGNGKTLGENDRFIKATQQEIHENIEPVIPTKTALISDDYQELKLIYQDYDFEIRAYDNGVAYRFISKLEAPEIQVMDEAVEVVLSKDYLTYFPEEKQLISHFENYYDKKLISEIETNAMGNLPMLFTDGNGTSVSITESDVYGYPNLLLKKKGTRTFESLFPKYVLKTKELRKGQDRLEVIEEEAPYIAVTDGHRSFPWRVFMISSNDKEIVSNNLVYQLASPLKLTDTFWIKPGKVSWDWWNANNLYGVDFKNGLNTETYKYYIDFAAEHDLEYIILDEGWSKSTLNVMEPNDEIDMKALTQYAKDKGVGIILWSLWRPLDENMEELFEQYEKWGIKGVKVDFIQRADQYVVSFYERLAKEAAEHHLLVNYHGSFKPSGMRRGYPNIINYEGVKGLENHKWEDKITPEHNLTLPFTRMTAGIMDYTPGAMDNVHKKDFMPRFERPMALGTRAHQLAMYVVYEAPLQMLSDSPSNYYKEKETTEFISRIPTTWEETKILEAKISDYLLLARRNGDTWYIGGMTDETARSFTIDFSFLEEGKNYKIEWIEDGINSDRVAKDFKKITRNISKNEELEINMHSGGGWVAIVSKV